jgi:cardiolipin synthase (CMP-forming)
MEAEVILQIPWHFLPNFLTLIRLLLVPVIIVALFSTEYCWAFICFVIASITDGMDGFLARRYGWKSGVGSVLDPISDLCLLVSSAVVLWLMGHFPGWCLWVILIRDGMILLGAVLFRLIFGAIDIDPLRSGKWCAVSQMLLVSVILLEVIGVGSLEWLKISLVWTTVILCIVSGWLYLVVWGRKWQALGSQRSDEDSTTYTACHSNHGEAASKRTP